MTLSMCSAKRKSTNCLHIASMIIKSLFRKERPHRMNQSTVRHLKNSKHFVNTSTDISKLNSFVTHNLLVQHRSYSRRNSMILCDCVSTTVTSTSSRSRTATHYR